MKIIVARPEQISVEQAEPADPAISPAGIDAEKIQIDPKIVAATAYLLRKNGELYRRLAE